MEYVRGGGVHIVPTHQEYTGITFFDPWFLEFRFPVAE